MTAPSGQLPRWLSPANKVVMALNRAGLPLGTQHILSVPGRRSGQMRSTPVSLIEVDGHQYVVTGFETQWVKNARTARWGTMQRGRTVRAVRLHELPVNERPRVLREFPAQVPHGTPFFERLLGLPADPEAFAAAADRCPVFRIDPWQPPDPSPSPTDD